MHRTPTALALAAGIGFVWLGQLGAQVKPAYSLGASGLMQVLQRLQTTASVLHTGAHPDDEDSFFIARTARGDHARVGYLSLNRGEGGQNIIGPELFEPLGVIRTEELLQARRLDGGEQFFTRTFDYGFSKSLEEAKAKWDETQVLGDMVRIIRTFRPLVIYSRFSGTPADGHGHHQFAGYATPLAFTAAADPTQFPEQIAEGLKPWQARKLYRGQRFPPGSQDPPSVSVQAGDFDPVLGRSYAEIASEGRSQHKSQSMGSIELKGPIATGLRLLESRVPAPEKESTPFDGIDTTLPGLAALTGLPPGALQRELQAVAHTAATALDEYDPRHPERLLPTLAEGIRATQQARRALNRLAFSDIARFDADFLLRIKEAEFQDAMIRAAGIVIDPLADRETVVPGSSFGVSVRVFAPAESPLTNVSAIVRVPEGWSVTAVAGPLQDETGNPFARREQPTFGARYNVTVGRDAAPTQPYFLERPRPQESYAWSDPARGLPFAPPLVQATVSMELAGEMITASAPVEYRTADQVRGELRRLVNVTPPVTVAIDSTLLIVPINKPALEHRIVVQATAFSPAPLSGTLRLRMPPGWSSLPAEAAFSLKQGEQTSAPFVIRPPSTRQAGTQQIVAEAIVDGASYSQSVQVVAYPHIQTHRLYRTAAVTAEVIDLAVAPVRVGYIMGTGDEIPDALRRMGVDVQLIGPEQLATGDLSAFDTIVVGIRASQARPDFVANHGRLLQYVERGGTLIVQYQQQDYIAKKLLPYPAEMASRVTDERAPVEMLQPAHPVFTFPNRISAADFDGWVQDRNLYGFTSFDSRYTPLLATADRGEKPQLGGQVYAAIGKGHFVYTAYAWFRQLPAGVPGAYRQFANLISLPKAR